MFKTLVFLQLFFEDNIDDAKYCGRLYGLGSGSSQPQNGLSSSGAEETNNKHWPEYRSLQVEHALVLNTQKKNKPNQQIFPLISNQVRLIFPQSDCKDELTVNPSLTLVSFSRFYSA